MTLLTPEQIAAANKAQFDMLFGLTNKAFEGMEKLLELNLQVVKSTLAESQENTQRVLSVKDAQELLALQASLAQPVAEKALSYGRHLYEIASSTQAEFARVAEAQYEDQNRKVQALVDNVAKNAPAGSETAVAVMKSAITAANTTYETIHKASKQAVEIAESNFNAAATAATKAASQATAQASRAAVKKPA
ncbi:MULTISPECIES: phasin family protein [Burkholderiaceae]|jgi:phasin family protein|uniref:Granule-associated protein n=1 Tax=Caballeronia sordidicola TaxID=196367 RepID=A0A242MEU9_CABSO|nr:MULTISPECIES: phasin family protein [Burkholderiaceae]MDP9155553.1 phasin family protein [Pseudomonadota bacterium]AME24341.1 Phasin (PHA-granule associated protein) [Burkholderia sp. PAMC 26561]AMM13568.1 Phasin (PHA-granule associated protein) [Burkholderia sp. PAMC 28687]OTP69831.1 granule-associated protein [Caballeronia sordidicola]OTP80741.1 granule-associated protein [Caballeronia sordidicola]